MEGNQRVGWLIAKISSNSKVRLGAGTTTTMVPVGEAKKTAVFIISLTK